jgi:hypothetical protein
MRILALKEAEVKPATLLNERNPIDVSMDCTVGFGKVLCTFNFANNGINVIYMNTQSTPIEGMLANFLKITKDGLRLPYDGVYLNRHSEDFDYELMPNHITSLTIDISSAYNFKSFGRYKITYSKPFKYKFNSQSVVSYLLYRPNISSILYINEILMHPPVGELARNFYQPSVSYQREEQKLILPGYSGNSTKSQRTMTTQIHKAVYSYLDPAVKTVDIDISHYRKWFGDFSKDRAYRVKGVFASIKTTLENDKFIYHYNGTNCLLKKVLGYTWVGARVIYLCPLQYEFPTISHQFSQMSTLLHEMTHAVGDTRDIAYGYDMCRIVADHLPRLAIENAANYGLYFITINPMDFGIDSIGVYKGHTFITRGPVYANYTISLGLLSSCDYPKLILGNWGELPAQFADGFDAILVNDDKMIATKGSLYFWMSTLNDRHFRVGKLSDELPEPFNLKFNSAANLQDGKTYITSGSVYIRCTGFPENIKIDKGYPKLIKNNWRGFTDGFDAMSSVGKDRICLFSGEMSICYNYSNISRSIPTQSKNVVNPVSIRGNFGRVALCNEIVPTNSSIELELLSIQYFYD